MASDRNQTGGNPLFAVETGSVVSGRTGKFGATVLNGKLTKFNDKMQFQFSRMSSNSTFLASGNQNQGSIAVSGSYGVSGVASVEAGVSAYVGREKSDVAKHLTMNMDAYRLAGVEYINLDNMDLATFITGLTMSTGLAIVDILDIFLEYNQETDAVKKETALTKWITAQRRFFKLHGDAVVIATLVGAWGGVKMDVTALTNEVMWKGGGKLKVAAAGTGASGSFQSAFGHSEFNNDQKANGSVESYSYGDAIAPVIDSWREKLETLVTGTLTELGKTTLGSLGEGPKVELTDPPKFKPKKKDAKIAGKIGSIKDLKGLEALAKASAFDDYKRECEKSGTEPQSLKDFLDGLDAENDVENIPTEEDFNVQPDNLQGMRLQSSAANLSDVQESAPRMLGASEGTKGFVTMGAWVVEWGQIIPWLVAARDNSVPADNKAFGMVQLRAMQSDFEALYRLYDRVRIEGLHIANVDFNPLEISNTFLSAANKVNKFLSVHLTKLGGRKSMAEVHSECQKIVTGLGVYKKIYEVWCDHPEMRRAELGFAMIVKNHTQGRSYVPATLEYMHHMELPRAFWELEYTDNHFDPTSAEPNYSLFADKIKGIPVILPDGSITLLVSNGNHESSGFLTDRDNVNGGAYVEKTKAEGIEHEATDWTTPQGDRLKVWIAKYWNAITFRADETGTLRAYTFEAKTGDQCRISLHPIPISAVQPGIEWQGAAVSRGLGEMRGQLDALRESLSGLPAWSLGSDHWGDLEKQITHIPTELQRLRPQYIGLVEEPAGLFTGD